MLLAEGHRPAALDVKRRLLCTGDMRATLAEDVHHAVLSVLSAVHRRLAALHVEYRFFRARII